MKRFLPINWIALGVLVVTSPVVYADISPIAVYDTGAAAGGLLTGGTADPYYTVVSSPASVNSVLPTVVDYPGAFAFPYWAADGPNSQWISLIPGNTAAGGGLYTEPDGVYVYETTFILPADFVSATLSGIWGSDNEGIGVSLNGPSLVPLNPNPGNFGVWPGGAATFSFDSGFVKGLNTLDFTLQNDVQATGNPEGLRVELGGSFVTPVPDPGFYAVLALGLAALAVVGRFRRIA